MNTQEVKFRFSDDKDYRFIDTSFDGIKDLINDFNYNEINNLINNNKYAKRAGLQPLKPVYPIIEHIAKPLDKAFYDSVCGIYTPIPHADTIALEQYRRIEAEQVIPYTSTKTINSFKRKENILHLATHTRCVCAETGITFAVQLPNPLHISFSMLHPYAFYNNVVQEIKTYQKNGIPISGIESQALAGMLITILKHKGYAICRDYMAANLRLRTINKKSLTWALAYFYRAAIRENMPQINLLAEGNPTTQLIGFIQICRGEDMELQAHHAMEKKQAVVKAKVYQTAEAKEAASLKNDVKVCIELLERIADYNDTVSDEMITAFTHRIRKLAILNDAAKEVLIADLIGAFGENAQIKQLELIIRTNEMTATQKELLTFSQTIAKELDEFKNEKSTGKIDFATLMGKKG